MCICLAVRNDWKQEKQKETIDIIVGIEDEPISAVDWSRTQLMELDISSTDLSEQAMLELFSSLPKLNYLSVAYCDGFTDQVESLSLLSLFRLTFSFHC